MRLRDAQLTEHLKCALSTLNSEGKAPGISNSLARDVLVQQLIDSVRRVQFVSVVASRNISHARRDPASELFDPIRAAILCAQNGEHDEACWFVFLFVHFGKSGRTGYRLSRDVYGSLGGSPWTWARARANPGAMRTWLSGVAGVLKGSDGVSRQYGNHRKYETLDAGSDASPGAVIESYIKWVGDAHIFRFQEAMAQANGDGGKAFDLLYRSMATVSRFGRTARFDYLTMIGKIGLAPIKPPLAYLAGATGPLRGARLLFGGSSNANLSAASLETRLDELDSVIGVGKQVLEDALCNWQKSPLSFIRFYG